MAEPSAPTQPAARDERDRPRPQVLYVLGAHRSGSTILGVTLGNCDGLFFGGELHSWQGRRGVPSLGGERGARLWDDVRARVDERDALFGKETQMYIDRTSSLYRVHRWRARRRLKRPYRRAAALVFSAIAEAADARCVVDSSHYPLRARELQAVDGIDLYILFLTRDPEGIVASMSGRVPGVIRKSELGANMQLWITYGLSVLTFLRQPRERRLFVRHEDFLADPSGVLRQILDMIGSTSPIPDLDALDTGCVLQGNRFLRGKDVISLQGPSASKRSASRATRVLQSFWPLVFARMRPAAVADPESARARR